MICQTIVRKTTELRVNLKEDEKCCIWTSVLKHYTVTAHETFLQTSQLPGPLMLEGHCIFYQ